MAGICSGVCFLAEAGILDGKRATTHWALADTMKVLYPAAKWDTDLLVTEDDGVYCSGGVYAAIDLSLYLVEKLTERTLAVECAKQAVRLLPSHFGAIAGLGHCFAELGELTLALRCYRRAKRINPQTEGLSDAIERLQTRVCDMSDSGYFELDAIPG